MNPSIFIANSVAERKYVDAAERRRADAAEAALAAERRRADAAEAALAAERRRADTLAIKLDRAAELDFTIKRMEAIRDDIAAALRGKR
jgi:hypothetical protein